MSHLGHLEGVPQPQLGDLLTMVTNHLLTGTILQADHLDYWVSYFSLQQVWQKNRQITDPILPMIHGVLPG